MNAARSFCQFFQNSPTGLLKRPTIRLKLEVPIAAARWFRPPDQHPLWSIKPADSRWWFYL